MQPSELSSKRAQPTTNHSAESPYSRNTTKSSDYTTRETHQAVDRACSTTNDSANHMDSERSDHLLEGHEGGEECRGVAG